MTKFLSSILTAGSILIFFILVLPSFDQTRILRNEIEERNNILAEAEEITNRVREINNEIDLRRSDIERLDNLLPEQKELPELLSNLESIVSASGMALSELNLSELTAEGEFRKIGGSARLNGSFTSFTNFLDLLERNLRLIDVTAISATLQAAEGSGRISYDVRFETSYLSR